MGVDDLLRSMEWRFIFSDVADANTHLAREEAILRAVDGGAAPPTFMLYYWKNPAATVCYGESLEDLNLEWCEKLGVEFARRLSGGKAVYHDPQRDFSYRIIVPKTMLKSGDLDNIGRYAELNSILIEAFALLGLKLESTDPNFLTVNGKKLVGSAQVIKKNAALQHGYILRDAPDLETRYKVIKTIDYLSTVQKARDTTTYLREHIKFADAELAKAIKKILPGHEGALSKIERYKERELLEVYRSEEWMERGDRIFGDCITEGHVTGMYGVTVLKN